MSHGSGLGARRAPRAHKRKVGFAVAIWAEDDEQAKKFAADFSFELSRLILAGDAGASFDFVDIPQRIVSKLRMDDEQSRYNSRNSRPMPQAKRVFRDEIEGIIVLPANAKR